MLTKEAISSYALSKVLRHEPRMAREAVELFDGAEGIFKMAPQEILDALGPYNKFALALSQIDLSREEEELYKLETQGYRYLSHDSPHFPQVLEMCEDAPLGFFVRSKDEFQNIFSRENIAIVGTRDASTYGIDWTIKMVNAIAESGANPTIVSGLAYGIDINAHRASLENGLPTIAVLGTGIDNIYPSRHVLWAERIINTEKSAVISECPPGTEVLSTSFLCRNRIIAGLSRATLLMESRVKGGGMSTARIAESYGRMVFALPGRNDDVRSQGCNELLHSHIAEPLIDCEHFLKALEYHCKRRKTKKELDREIMEKYNGNENMLRIAEAIRKQRGISAEELSECLGLPYRDIMTAIAILESDGFIKSDLLCRCIII